MSSCLSYAVFVVREPYRRFHQFLTNVSFQLMQNLGRSNDPEFLTVEVITKTIMHTNMDIYTCRNEKEKDNCITHMSQNL